MLEMLRLSIARFLDVIRVNTNDSELKQNIIGDIERRMQVVLLSLD